MTRRERLRVQINVLRFDLRERLYDLGNLAFPIFVVSGIGVASLKFWWWALS